MPDVDALFLRACRAEPTERPPIWFMRQAGRSLPEYRALRSGGSILDAVRDPALACEITLQPVRRYGVDAAILFSDIVVPVASLGIGVEIVAGRGPIVAEPFRTAADLDRIRPLEPETDTGYVLETVRLLVRELTVPLIGFAGAPFTVASYLIEGGPTRDFVEVKRLMHGDPALFAALLDRLADVAIASLRSQVAAGASAVQLFDSWAGALSRSDYERFVLPASRKVLAGVADLAVPRIHFGVGTGELLDLMVDAGADVCGVDWRVPLPVARTLRTLGRVPLQGNLDPALCLGAFDVVEAETRRILAEGREVKGHIFNLGHGVLPETDPDTLRRLVDLVQATGVTAGVVVMAYGSPRSLGEVEQYYTDIRRGRRPSEAQLAELQRRYEAIGGLSPLNERTETQIAAIDHVLAAISTEPWVALYGTKHSTPSIEDAVRTAAERGVSRIVGLVLAPHYAVASVGEYIARASAIAAEIGVPATFVERYGSDPALIELLADRVEEALATFGADRDRTEVIFTAHALPLASLGPKDRYAAEIAETAALVAERTGLTVHTGWQSAGMTPDPWLGPDIAVELEMLAAAGCRNVVVCPCGFTSDHLEVLYDLDIVAAARAEELGIRFVRTRSLNEEPRFAAMLADRVLAS